MRTKNNIERAKVGDIFRNKLETNKKDKKDPAEKKEARERDREKRRHKKRKEVNKAKEDLEDTTTDQNSKITNQRITSKLGIYNKGKSSRTIFKDQDILAHMKKSVPNQEEDLKKDLSRVLDCSSFRIQPFTASCCTNTVDMPSSDAPICIQRQFSGRLSHNSSPRSIATVRSSVCGSAVSSCSQSSQYRLPFRTPLNEISENLISSLCPAETFNGRNYFNEVKEQLLKVFKQSCGRLNNADQKEGQVSSEVHKRCLKRKAAGSEESFPKIPIICDKQLQDNQRYFVMDFPSTNHDNESVDSRIDVCDVIEKANVHENAKESNDESFDELFDKKKARNTESYSFTSMEELRSQRRKVHHQDLTSNCTTSGFDIIDFIDRSSTTENPNNKLTCNQKCLDVSPPKKPSLDTPTPPRFYRRKMY